MLKCTSLSVLRSVCSICVQRTGGLLLGCIGSFFDSLNALREGFQIGGRSSAEKVLKNE